MVTFYFINQQYFDLCQDSGLISLWFLVSITVLGMGYILQIRFSVKSDIDWPFPQVQCHHCPSVFCMQDIILVKNFILGWCLFPFSCPEEYLQKPKTLGFTHEVICVCVVLSNGATWSVCRDQPTAIIIAWSVWKFQWNTLTNNSIEPNSVPPLEYSFGEKRKAGGTHITPIIRRFHQDYHYFGDFPLYQVSIPSSKCSSILVFSPCIPFIHNISPSPPQLIFIFGS